MATESQPMMPLDVSGQERPMHLGVHGPDITARDDVWSADGGDVHFTGQELGLGTTTDIEFPDVDPETLVELGLINYAEARSADNPDESMAKIASSVMFGAIAKTPEGDLNAHFMRPTHPKPTSRRKVQTPDRQAEHPNLQ